MHHQRRRAVPGAHEPQQVVDMLVDRYDHILGRIGDVVELQPQMVGDVDAGQRRHPGLIGQQGNDMAGAGFGDRVVQTGQ
jgi:hypothetical protein